MTALYIPRGSEDVLALCQYCEGTDYNEMEVFVLVNDDQKHGREKTSCQCPFCDEPTCPAPAESESLCSVTLITCAACGKAVRTGVALCSHCGQHLPG